MGTMYGSRISETGEIKYPRTSQSPSVTYPKSLNACVSALKSQNLEINNSEFPSFLRTFRKGAKERARLRERFQKTFAKFQLCAKWTDFNAAFVLQRLHFRGTYNTSSCYILRGFQNKLSLSKLDRRDNITSLLSTSSTSSPSTSAAV